MDQPPAVAQESKRASVAQESKKQESSAQEPARPSSEQESKQRCSEQPPTNLKQSADLVGVPLGVPDGTEVIDWAAAVDQCSGDVSFLEELLVDLWNESNAHMQQLKDSVPRGAMLDTQHEAHSIKGAAANLMCHRMRLAALYMERAGQVGTRLKEGSDEYTSVKRDLEKGMEVLENELGLFQKMLMQKKLV